MIRWLIKIGTPGWEGGTRWKLAGIGTLLDIALFVFCIFRMLMALRVDDYAQATFFLVLAFAVSRKRSE